MVTVAGLCLVALSFFGPGFPLLVAGAVVMTLGGVLETTRRQ